MTDAYSRFLLLTLDAIDSPNLIPLTKVYLSILYHCKVKYLNIEGVP